MDANKQKQSALLAYIVAKTAQALRAGIIDRTEPSDRLAARSLSIVRCSESLCKTLRQHRHGSALLACDLERHALDLADALTAGTVSRLGGEESAAAQLAADVINAATELADALSKDSRAKDSLAHFIKDDSGAWQRKAVVA